ncbi:hypothetical protein KAFR_0A07590 [Kazachstania africana CBS 2517]|uniref:Protein SWT21 n=1 Tax=Kazachstania africana (strain ATCC 22294 / BCRC 22015 / CBS 2517 / CECT 1963 / NBRC 1671 / NRRL Y-8276) TaxID=1071382 RepID=H2AP93_KAZAF|nr:hypothetical protein KAFR_0A07590 [Kazachstania africana CBS 2517]CCF56193.1 hypothetical protein KAFR_0A07590 [Kazachstania africana CBS 2517]
MMLKLLNDTSSIFHGSNAKDVWLKEDAIWRNLTDSTGDYTFPPLSQYKYVDSVEVGKAVICQDMFWSYDGSSIATIHNDTGIRQYLIPEHEGVDLIPYTRFFKNRSIVSSDIHPGYSLYNDDMGFNNVLLGSRDLPIQLYSLDPNDTENVVVFHYNVMNQENERFEVPYSLRFIDKSTFVMGSDRNRINLYDTNRSECLWSQRYNRSQLNPKKIHKSVISCFETNKTRSVAYCGSYSDELFKFDLRNNKIVNVSSSYGRHSNGIYQIISSENGNYLYILRRNSNTIDVIDTRYDHTTVNKLQLTFALGNIKHKAHIDTINGLLIGDTEGNLLNWSRDIIEFGGIELTNQGYPNCESNVNLLPDRILYSNSSATRSRINIVKTDPNDPHIISASHSPCDNKSSPCNITSKLSILSI